MGPPVMSWRLGMRHVRACHGCKCEVGGAGDAQLGENVLFLYAHSHRSYGLLLL